MDNTVQRYEEALAGIMREEAKTTFCGALGCVTAITALVLWSAAVPVVAVPLVALFAYQLGARVGRLALQAPDTFAAFGAKLQATRERAAEQARVAQASKTKTDYDAQATEERARRVAYEEREATLASIRRNHAAACDERLDELEKQQAKISLSTAMSSPRKAELLERIDAEIAAMVLLKIEGPGAKVLAGERQIREDIAADTRTRTSTKGNPDDPHKTT